MTNQLAFHKTFGKVQMGKKNDWTSLHGGEKLTLLRKLPENFNKNLPPERAPVVQNVWIVSTTKIETIFANLILNNVIDYRGHFIRHLQLQSWTKLVETNAISERISQFPCVETRTRSPSRMLSV